MEEDHLHRGCKAAYKKNIRRTRISSVDIIHFLFDREFKLPADVTYHGRGAPGQWDDTAVEVHEDTWAVR